MTAERESVRLVRAFLQHKVSEMELCTVSQHAIHKHDYERLKEILQALEKEKPPCP